MDLLIPVDSTDHALGPDNAPVTLVEYGDYECPHCGQAYPIIKRLKATLGDRLRVVYRHFPQNSVHPHASVAAQAAEAAHAQGKFWAMHDQLFEHQTDLADDLTAYAIRAGLEIYKFQADLSSERYARKVRSDYEGGVRNGVHKTPTIFLNGGGYSGPLEYEAILAAIQKLL
ncbi:MAG TPA: DsbA family protein [Tepidisphaeraceae bacterium]|jgi:protein-disulfide isomerase